MSTLFCRHNRFTADCPICSRGTVLDSSGPTSARRPAASKAGAESGGGDPARRGVRAARVTGPYAEAGPYEDAAGASYRVRLERVPGGLRLAEWAGGGIRRRAPVLAAADVGALVEQLGERSILSGPDVDRLLAAVSTPAEPEGRSDHGASPGRSGDLRDELRVERAGEGLVRITRAILRPGTGWEALDAPPMLPVARFAEALAAGVRAGVIGPSPTLADGRAR